SKGRRDPFAPVSLAAENKGITLTAAKLVGIVQGRPGLMALVEGPDGIGYILKPGDALGNGRVTAITAASVTFAVSAQPGQGPTFAWNRTAMKSDGDPVREVRGSQFRVGTARVVVELSRKVGYRIDERPEGLALVLESGATAQADKPAPRAKETSKAPAPIP